MNELTTTRATDGVPEITHELIEFHMRRGRRLRAEAMQQVLRQTWRWLSRGLWAGRGHGRHAAPHAH